MDRRGQFFIRQDSPEVDQPKDQPVKNVEFKKIMKRKSSTETLN